MVRACVEKQNGGGTFVEVFVDTPLEVCIARDPKGLYQQAIEGKIKNFTGISDPYEAPEAPDLHLRSETSSADALAKQVIDYLSKHGVIT